MSGRCISLADAADEKALGGKAEGLAQLISHGFAVPPGFVITGAKRGKLGPEVLAAYEKLGQGRVAVRSSSLSEDGAEASYAGQYETVLGVEGKEALQDAVDRCLASLESARVKAYETEAHASHETRMAVVVQRMVEPRCAGVVFTADPVTSRRDRLVVDAVAGLGEALVSGEETPDHYVVRASGGQLISQDLAGDAALLTGQELESLTSDALRAVEQMGAGALDLEWAIDEAGKLFWLQARPVTTLGADPGELDTRPPSETDVYTRSNIGEMLPGAVTPLTASVTGRGIDVGMQRMLIQLGIDPDETPHNRFVGVYSGQLFLNLSTLSKMGTHMAGASVDRICQAICGRTVAELPEGKLAGFWTRLRSGLRYARYLLGATGRVERLRRVYETLVCAGGDSAREQWQRLDNQLELLWQCYDHHLASSALSGAMTSTIVEALAKGKPPEDQHHAELARLLAGAEGVESADIAAGLDRLADVVAAQPDAAEIPSASDEELLAWLQGGAPEVTASYQAYLKRHGHRAVRELELREKEWSLEPAPVLAHLRTAVAARLAGSAAGAPELAAPDIPRGMGLLVKWAHAGVRSREATKSLLVRAGVEFKVGYRRLGELLEAEAALPDADAVFFLTHQELGQLVESPALASSLAQLAEERRQLLPVQQQLQLPEIFVGYPEELRLEHEGTDELVGRAVSHGQVTGTVRVARTPAEAAKIQPGEILVAPITDVGWTPCFGVIGGLVTDLGSAVSHGAVVAREYGLPCVVNTRVGTSVLQTGDEVELNGSAGTVRILSRASIATEAENESLDEQQVAE